MRLNDEAELTSYTTVSRFKARQLGLAGQTCIRHPKRVEERRESFISRRGMVG